jgi:hypothetical protein
MGRTGGGSIVARGLEALEEALTNYFGVLTEIRMGINAKPPEKPEALILWNQCQAMGLPLVSGGTMNQPHLWMQEVAVITDVVTLFAELERQGQEP